MKIHKLKTAQPFFDDIFSGKKNFEYRKDDRDYQVGDRLDLFEGTEEITDETDVRYRKHTHVWVTYKLSGGQFGIPDGYCILGLTHEEPEEEKPKYITVSMEYEIGQVFKAQAWWAPKNCLNFIATIENDNPAYEFVQIVTSPGNGGYKEFAIMKLRDNGQ